MSQNFLAVNTPLVQGLVPAVDCEHKMQNFGGLHNTAKSICLRSNFEDCILLSHSIPHQFYTSLLKQYSYENTVLKVNFLVVGYCMQ